MYVTISNPTNYHAALYIRLSKEDESEGPSQSVQNQESLLREFVQQHRLSVYDTYVDDGWSGTNFNRPDFQRIFGRIKGEREQLEGRHRELERRIKGTVFDEVKATELVQRFIKTAVGRRKILVSIIKRVESTKDKEVIIRFQFDRAEEATGLKIK